MALQENQCDRYYYTLDFPFVASLSMITVFNSKPRSFSNLLSLLCCHAILSAQKRHELFGWYMAALHISSISSFQKVVFHNFYR